MFTENMKKTRKMIFWVTLVLLVFFVTGFLVVTFAERESWVYAEILSAIDVILFVIVLISLLIIFLRNSQVQEKRQLNRMVKKVQDELSSTNDNLAAALQDKARILEVYRDQKEQEKIKLTGQTAVLQSQIEGLQLTQEQELLSALMKMQDEHLQAALLAVPIDPLHIPGIGEMLADKLQQSGLRTAWDINQEAVQTIPGFGDSKALSLVRWRESLEYDIRKTQPETLPLDVENEIKQKFALAILDKQGELERLQTSHSNSLENLRMQEANEVANVTIQENTARQSLVELEAQSMDLDSRLALYKGISFPKFILAVVSGADHRWFQKLLSYVVVLVFFILGIANVVLLVSILVQTRI